MTAWAPVSAIKHGSGLTLLPEVDNSSDDGNPKSVSGTSSVSGGKSSPWVSLKAVGPGLLVCLADTDAGCLVVAAQSGARWGYSLLLLQVVLIPILFMAQELTVRLGVHTRVGHTACIRKHFGCGWAWFACCLLVFECTCAMMSEMSGFAAVGELWGLTREASTIISAVLVVIIVFMCNYRQIETIGVTLGLFELVFVATMVCFHPKPCDIFRGMLTMSEDSEFVKLISANIGAVIMPWMIYFQQSAVVARNLVTDQDLASERTQTLLGSVLTQLVMIGTLVTLAAAHPAGKDLDTVMDIVSALDPLMGEWTSITLVSLGFIGGSLSAAFVVSLAASWAVCEAMGLEQALSLDLSPLEAPAFYGCFVLVVLVGVVVLLTGVNMVHLNVLVELMDGLLLPFAVGFLFLLSTGEALPPEHRVVGFHKVALAIIFSLSTALSSASAIYGLIGWSPPGTA